MKTSSASILSFTFSVKNNAFTKFFLHLRISERPWSTRFYHKNIFKSYASIDTTGHKNIIIIRQSIFKNHTILLHYYSILVHIWNGLSYRDFLHKTYNFMHITSYSYHIQEKIRAYLYVPLVSSHVWKIYSILIMWKSCSLKVYILRMSRAYQKSDSRENSNFSILFTDCMYNENKNVKFFRVDFLSSHIIMLFFVAI